MAKKKNKLDNVFITGIVKMMRPIVRLLIKYNITYDTISHIIRKLYAEEAKEELVIPGKKISMSRISVVTGIPRKEVQKYLDTPFEEEDNIHQNQNRASRVVTGWMTDKDYQDSENKTVEIPLDGTISFDALVKKYSGGVPTKAVYDELSRVKAITKAESGLIALQGFGYAISKEDKDTFLIVSENVSDLMKTILHNLSNEPSTSRLQLRVAANNLPAEIVDELRKLCTKEGRETLVSLGGSLQKYDRDHNDTVFGTGQFRAGVGIYFFQDDLTEQANEEIK
jgi:hypothetical protein